MIAIKQHYADKSTISKFDEVRKYLIENEGFLEEITSKTLSSLTCDFIIFQDKSLGIAAEKKQQIYTKISKKVFDDYSPGGSLCTFHKILNVERNLDKKLDFASTSAVKKTKNLEIFEKIQTELMNKGQSFFPTVFISTKIKKKRI